jgi:hypothetical protein
VVVFHKRTTKRSTKRRSFFTENKATTGRRALNCGWVYASGARFGASNGEKMYGHIYHPETGKCLAYVKDGKITGEGGVSYSLVGDMIVAADGTELGYLSPLNDLTKGNSDLSNQLFPRR